MLSRVSGQLLFHEADDSCFQISKVAVLCYHGPVDSCVLCENLAHVLCCQSSNFSIHPQTQHAGQLITADYSYTGRIVCWKFRHFVLHCGYQAYRVERLARYLYINL